MNKNATKADLKVVLEGYKDTVTDKSLKDRIAYTLKKYGESTKKTVLDLISDIEVALTPTPLPVENSVKPTLKKSAKSKAKTKEVEEEIAKENADNTEEVTEDTVDNTEEVVEEPKKSSPKKSGKNKAPAKKSLTPKHTKGATEASAPMAAIFPEKIEDDNIGTLVAVPDKYHTVEELREALEAGDKTIVICAYYPIALIKKYGYSNTDETDKRVPKKGFAHDLDIQQVIYCCSGIERAYALSDYTEAMFFYEDSMLEPTETVDSETGKTVMTRFANGCEFELYEVTND